MKTITRVFKQYRQAHAVARELERADILPSHVSLLANKDVSDSYQVAEDVSGAEAGHEIGVTVAGPAARLASVEHRVIPGSGPAIVTGWLADFVPDSVDEDSTEGIAETLMSVGVREDDADFYAEAVRRGETLLAFQVEDEELNAIQAILDRHSSSNPGVPPPARVNQVYEASSQVEPKPHASR